MVIQEYYPCLIGQWRILRIMLSIVDVGRFLKRMLRLTVNKYSQPHFSSMIIVAILVDHPVSKYKNSNLGWHFLEDSFLCLALCFHLLIKAYVKTFNLIYICSGLRCNTWPLLWFVFPSLRLDSEVIRDHVTPRRLVWYMIQWSKSSFDE